MHYRYTSSLLSSAWSIYRFATTLSMNFDMKLTFVRYRPIWIQVIRIQWWFLVPRKDNGMFVCESVRIPDSSEALHIRLKIDSSKCHSNTLNWPSRYRIELTACLVAGLRVDRREIISAESTGWKLDNGAASADRIWIIVTGAALAVDERIFSIFDEKWRARSSAADTDWMSDYVKEEISRFALYARALEHHFHTSQ